jgi:hypothetical protein
MTKKTDDQPETIDANEEPEVRALLASQPTCLQWAVETIESAFEHTDLAQAPK